ncbi:hypothetical protein PTKIN_Ptkin04bG0039100 [Pterospermum kingtungense]
MRLPIKKDFVSIILQLQKEGMLEMNLTQDNIKAILLDMSLGRTDTSAVVIDWMMAELIKHPHIMKKVLQKRLHPIVSILPRKTPASVKLGGYDIPSNTTVYINAWAIHRDPNWWEQPEEFIPQRFENSPVDFKAQDFHFMPFGSGRKSCPGLQFGVASVEYMVANLRYWFDWKLPAGENVEDLDMTELYGLTVGRRVPLHVVPISHFSV